MAGLLDNTLPISRSTRQPIISPTPRDEEDDESMPTPTLEPTSSPIPTQGGVEDNSAAGTTVDSVAEPTQGPSGAANDDDNDNDNDNDDNEDEDDDRWQGQGREERKDANEETQDEKTQGEQSQSSSLTLTPSDSSADQPSQKPSTIPPTTLVTSALPFEIRPSSSGPSLEVGLTTQTSADAEDPTAPPNNSIDVVPSEDEELIVVPSPTTPLPLPQQQTTVADHHAHLLQPIPSFGDSSSSSSSSSRISGGDGPSTATGTEADYGAAATALSAPPDGSGGSGSGSGGGIPSGLMPALPISLGLAGGVLVLAVLVGTLYKRNAWPFRGRRREGGDFESVVEGEEGREMEKRQRMKWDPRVSRGWNGNVHS
ncbi:hypothetical protein SODALDRAFT_335485 [Sodiomyces alkalinus F11]|uniref:Uncharacterized protein n=1 Tax=Sodiomyces alkalinus (strain CBS 110278 / VKM F-3762 / F11) TaxID=1314773 RepID=A0A3N2PPK3_SODAK|nr:hypothetical protein SODALDRAFT_335485 [Sodiomyces alkalinus F11]ROT36384.1 hypothetical protein SODALDRAFT_335485 [Sodiomyces alkalinus F11]